MLTWSNEEFQIYPACDTKKGEPSKKSRVPLPATLTWIELRKQV